MPREYLHGFSFKKKELTPVDPIVMDLAEAVVDLNWAETELNGAKSRVPDYTGQWDDCDYYGDEQEAYNRAANHYADCVIKLVESRTIPKV